MFGVLGERWSNNARTCVFQCELGPSAHFREELLATSHYDIRVQRWVPDSASLNPCTHLRLAATHAAPHISRKCQVGSLSWADFEGLSSNPTLRGEGRLVCRRSRSARFLHQPTDACSRDSMFSRHLPERHSRTAIPRLHHGQNPGLMKTLQKEGTDLAIG
jgi:hypothetical protein